MDVVEGVSKRCSKCGDVKLLKEFYRKEGMKDGRLNKCIECTKRDQREGTFFPERHCVYCEADISKLNWKRTTCNAPKCKARWEEEKRGRKNLYSSAWWESHKEKLKAVNRWRKGKTGGEAVKKKDGVRLCRACGDPILNGNRFFCETCFELIQGSEVRLDGGYLFC